MKANESFLVEPLGPKPKRKKDTLPEGSRDKDDFDRLAKELIRLHPGLPERVKRQLPAALRAHKRPDENRKFNELMNRLAEKERERMYQQFLRGLRELLTVKANARRVGRPKSRKTTSEFIKERLLQRFDSYTEFMFKALMEEQVDLRGVKGLRLNMEKADFYHLWQDTVYAEESGRNEEMDDFAEAAIFNLGAWFASLLMRGLVLEHVTGEMDELLSVSDVIKARLGEHQKTIPLLEKLGVSQEFISSVGKDLERGLPNDLLRQVRKPKYSSRQITQLTTAIKEAEGMAYVDEVAGILGVTVDTLNEMVVEANRMRKTIEFCRDTDGEVFLKVPD